MPQSVLDTLTEAYNAAAEVAQGSPGETTSTVRAFASLVVDQLNTTSASASPEEANEYQARRYMSTAELACSTNVAPKVQKTTLIIGMSLLLPPA